MVSVYKCNMMIVILQTHDNTKINDTLVKI